MGANHTAFPDAIAQVASVISHLVSNEDDLARIAMRAFFASLQTQSDPQTDHGHWFCTEAARRMSLDAAFATKAGELRIGKLRGVMLRHIQHADALDADILASLRHRWGLSIEQAAEMESRHLEKVQAEDAKRAALVAAKCEDCAFRGSSLECRTALYPCNSFRAIEEGAQA